MQNIVLIQVDDLRQIIREELAVNKPLNEPEKTKNEKPINQRDLCKFLDLSEPTVIRWRKKGLIPFMQIGSAIRYDVNRVIEALENGKKKPNLKTIKLSFPSKLSS